MGLLDKIKGDVKKAGTNKGKFMYFREGNKIRIRFLQDMDEGLEVIWHDSYEQGINVPCRETFGKSCPYCERDDLRTRSQYVWSVWNYDAKEVQLFMFPVNQCSPLPSIVAMCEQYGTLCDRDYVVSVSGKGTSKSYAVIPMDKVRFRNEKAKPFSKQQVLKMIDKAWPDDSEDDDEAESDELPWDEKKNKKSSKNSASKKPSKKDDYEEEEDEDWESPSDDETPDYESMSPKELYKLCKEREISEAVPKKPVKFYINLLEEYDQANNDWGSEEDDDKEDDWEDE